MYAFDANETGHYYKLSKSFVANGWTVYCYKMAKKSFQLQSIFLLTIKMIQAWKMSLLTKAYSSQPRNFIGVKSLPMTYMKDNNA